MSSTGCPTTALCAPTTTGTWTVWWRCAGSTWTLCVSTPSPRSALCTFNALQHALCSRHDGAQSRHFDCASYPQGQHRCCAPGSSTPGAFLMDTPDVKYWRHVFRAAAVSASKVLSTCADCFCVLAKLAAYFVTGLHARLHILFAAHGPCRQLHRAHSGRSVSQLAVDSLWHHRGCASEHCVLCIITRPVTTAAAARTDCCPPPLLSTRLEDPVVLPTRLRPPPAGQAARLQRPSGATQKPHNRGGFLQPPAQGHHQAVQVRPRLGHQHQAPAAESGQGPRP